MSDPWKVRVVESVPARDKVLEAVKVLPAPRVSVPEPAVRALPLIVVAVAAPMLGVVKEGEVARTTEPEPVEVLPKAVIVPEASGRVHVLSAVGSATVRRPSLVSAPPVAPSKMIPVEANSDRDADKAGLPARVAV